MYQITEAHVYAIQEARKLIRTATFNSKNPIDTMHWRKMHSLLLTVETNAKLQIGTDHYNPKLNCGSDGEY